MFTVTWSDTVVAYSVIIAIARGSVDPITRHHPATGALALTPTQVRLRYARDIPRAPWRFVDGEVLGPGVLTEATQHLAIECADGRVGHSPDRTEPIGWLADLITTHTPDDGFAHTAVPKPPPSGLRTSLTPDGLGHLPMGATDPWPQCSPEHHDDQVPCDAAEAAFSDHLIDCPACLVLMAQAATLTGRPMNPRRAREYSHAMEGGQLQATRARLMGDR